MGKSRVFSRPARSQNPRKQPRESQPRDRATELTGSAVQRPPPRAPLPAPPLPFPSSAIAILSSSTPSLVSCCVAARCRKSPSRTPSASSSRSFSSSNPLFSRILSPSGLSPPSLGFLLVFARSSPHSLLPAPSGKELVRVGGLSCCCLRGGWWFERRGAAKKRVYIGVYVSNGTVWSRIQEASWSSF